MLLLAALGGGLATVIVAITVLSIAGTVRVIRSVVLVVKEMAYVDAARATGVPNLRIMLRHVAPQTIAPRWYSSAPLWAGPSFLKQP